MNKVVSELNKGLKEGNTKIDVSKGIGKNLTKELENFKEQFSKLSDLTKGDKFEFADTKEVLRSGEAVIKTFKEISRLVGEFDDLTLFDAKKLFPDAFNSQVEETRQKFEGLRKSLIDLNDKKIRLDEATNELNTLKTQQEELLKSLEQQRSVVIDTEGAQQELDDAIVKVQALKEELKNSIRADFTSIEAEAVDAVAKRDEILKNREVRGAVAPTMTVTEAKKAKLSQEQIDEIRLYKEEDAQLKALGQTIKENEVKAKRLREVLLADSDKTSLSELAKTANASSEKVEEVTQATKKLTDAQKKQKDTKSQFEAQAAAVKKTEAEYETLTGQIEKQEGEVKKLQASYDNLKDKINPDELKRAFSELNIDFSEDMVRDEQAVEGLREKLDSLEKQDFNKLIDSLKTMGVQVDNTEDLVKQLKAAFGEAEEAVENFTETQKEIDRLKNSILEFFSITNTISLLKRTVNSATESIKALDAVMTEAAVVTDFSVSDMWEQMPQYSKNASDLGASTKDLYAATTLYYQQGLTGNEVMRVGIETMKMAKIANMDATDATTAMTAALRGFNMQVNEINAQKVNDVYSKLAAVTAADTSKIATAMGKTASIAASANMEFETTAAFLAQIIETTQEAPETAGTALKTIIARFGEVKQLQNQGLTSGVDAEGEAIDINKISTALRSVGISMDAFFAGQEGLDDVLLRLSEKWGTLDFQTQHYIATMAAGSRQQSRFIAMMSNYGRTMELVNEANNSAGASQEQYEKTLDSLDAKLTQLKNAWEQFTMGLANNELLKAGVNALTWALETINKITDAISGGSGLIKSIVSLSAVIGGLKLGGKILGKNSTTDGLLGKIGGKLGLKGNQKQEYQRGVKDGKAYGEGWGAGLKEATQDIPAPEFSTPSGGNGPEDVAEKLNKVSVAAIGVGAAFGALSALFEASGMDEAAKATGELAKTFTVMGTIVPIVGKAVQLAGLEGMAAWSWALGASAVIAILAVGISHALEASKKKTLEYRLEQAEKATEEAKKAAEEAKAAYEDLLDSKSGYDDLQKTLNNLTKGTKEWKSALIDANQQVLELIEKYPELSTMEGAINYEGGRLSISDEAWGTITDLTLARSQFAQTAYVGTTIDQTALMLEKQFSDMAKASGGGFSAKDIEELYRLATISDSEARSEEQSSRIEALNAEIDRLKGLAGTGTGQMSSVFLARAAGLEKQVEFLTNNLDSFANEYAQKMETYTAQLEDYTKALLTYTTEETQQSPFYDKVVGGLATYRGEDAYDALKEEQARVLALGEDEVRKQYYELTGQEADADANVEDLARDIASHNLAKTLSGDADKIVGLINEIPDQSMQRIVAAALSGDTSGLTMDELGQLKTMDWRAIAGQLGFDARGMGEFHKLTGLGYVATSGNQSIYNEDYSKLKSGLKGAFDKNEGFIGGLTVESVAKLVSQIEGGNLNSAQADNLIKSLQTILTSDKITEDDRLMLENTFANTNWSDPFAVMNAMDMMFKMGINQADLVKYTKAATAGGGGYVDSTAEGLQFAARMQGKTGEMGDLSKRLAEGTATQEDLEFLKKIGIETDNYKLTAEGWKATAEETDEAIGKMQEYYLTEAELQKQAIIAELNQKGTTEERKAVLNETLGIVQKTIDMLKEPNTTTYSIETNIDLLDRIKQAIVFDRQKEIDKLSEINATIADSNSRIVSAMRESVESYRRQRENERMEESIAEKQSRLSYLKMDTSGANAMEIKRLEEEIAQEQESYTDKLIDEKISELERQNDVAQEQRAQQIALMEAQLAHDEKTGALWEFAQLLIEGGYNKKTGELNENSELVKLLKQAEGYNGLSTLAQDQWSKDLLTAFKEGIGVEVKVDVYLGDDKLQTLSPVVNTKFGVKPGLPSLQFEPTQLQAYSTGGLADYTGPAWLDGTKTNPEYVLSAQQTERFFELVDVLSSLKSGPSNPTQNNRESNFDIDINVESIGSDYDVEQVAEKVKDLIVNNSRYRNNNIL